MSIKTEIHFPLRVSFTTAGRSILVVERDFDRTPRRAKKWNGFAEPTPVSIRSNSLRNSRRSGGAATAAKLHGRHRDGRLCSRARRPARFCRGRGVRGRTLAHSSERVFWRRGVIVTMPQTYAFPGPGPDAHRRARKGIVSNE